MVLYKIFCKLYKSVNNNHCSNKTQSNNIKRSRMFEKCPIMVHEKRESKCP